MEPGLEPRSRQAVASPATSYSTGPYADPVFDAARVAEETPVFDAWLRENLAAVPPERRSEPRDHLFALIDSRAKQLRAATGRALPAGPDLILAALFAWAEPLGVYGGSLVHAAVRPPPRVAPTPQLPVPAPFALHLDGELLVLSAESGGWSARFPYHFMPWRLDQVTPAGGARTLLAAVSTGTARHAKRPGHSQSTLMLAVAPGADHAAFVEHWSGVARTGDPLPEGADLASVRNRVFYDPKSDVHTELLHWRTPAASVALLYAGVDGPYQYNRPHFLDFLRGLRGDIAPALVPSGPHQTPDVIPPPGAEAPPPGTPHR